MNNDEGGEDGEDEDDKRQRRFAARTRLRTHSPGIASSTASHSPADDENETASPPESNHADYSHDSENEAQSSPHRRTAPPQAWRTSAEMFPDLDDT